VTSFLNLVANYLSKNTSI